MGIFPISGFIASDGIEMRNGTVMGLDEVRKLTGDSLAGHAIQYIEVDDVDSVGDQVRPPSSAPSTSKRRTSSSPAIT
ncbi:MAG: hypothetical protein M5U09_30540 [Gammaproteobacteria bacterium]|nr:hypothetical protein [Gammaproteobacteria bacterium]